MVTWIVSVFALKKEEEGMSSLQLIPGVFVLPPLLSAEHIASILQHQGPRLLGFCGPGSGDEQGHYVDSVHIENYNKRQKKKKEEQKPEDHSKPKKPHELPKTAECLWPQVKELLATERPLAVDPLMKLYRLTAGAGEVAPHQDEDFDGPDGSVARWSLLVYLNNDFEGGETVFMGAIPAPHLPVGGGLLFRHDVLHEGLKVHRGEKFVLKTDIFCQ